MKKFYIPTSTLNFNNILSSESISPKVFYERRGFGYSRWAVVPENPFNNAIVLYENICFFERPKSDMEDHPLLIEVELDEASLQQTDGFWYCDHSLYLFPTSTRFLFYDEKDRTIALSMSETSLETKLMRLYARQIQIIQKPNEWYMPITFGEPCELNELEIEKDARINKMKGMLYGYYIGSLLSSDIDSVKYLNVLKEIHNIFAAILSSFEKRPTTYQDKRLDVLFDYLNEQNNDYKSIYEILNSSTLDTKVKAKRILSWMFTRRGPWQNEEKSVWLSCLQYATEKDEKENRAITWIKRKIEDAKRQIQNNRHLLSPADGELVVMDNKVLVLKNSNLTNDIENRLCVSWMNEIFSDNSTNGKISTYKEVLAKNITLKAKDIYQNRWENSSTRTYLNDLRKHIVGEDFSHEWDNGLLSSIAAVVIAGDDWEKLLSFMQSKMMIDYKLAFAFFGELNGFANLTRDFTDLLFEQNGSYVSDVYKEFYGQLYGESILVNKNEKYRNITENIQQPDCININRIVATESVINEEFNNENTFEQTKVVYINPFVQQIIKHPKYNEQKYKTYIVQINETNLNNWNIIRSLSTKSDGWRGLIDDLVKKNKITKSDIQPLMFSEQEMYPVGQYFYCDKNVWYNIESLIADKRAKKEIKKDLEWLQNDIFAKPRGQRGYNYDNIDEKDNKIVIEKFCNLKRGKNDQGKEKAPYFSENLRMALEQKLKDLYHV